ncbi:fused response regulator/phosphatase [Zavarzinella formosa]|uniref:fused response regulator/phosphatase n=1 Tax=Zavarzinella formosa TaxID=360055 RepID=UPI00035E53C8|nr:fused response regulator/phosphatase [Zavarzinella formosa]
MSATSRVAAATEPHPTVVLLVDDQAIVGESIRFMLAELPNLEFHHCMDPAKAIPMANAIRPTVILLDLVMPEIDGLLLVKYFRANKATRETPMIVLSSKEEAVIKAKAFGLGANDYLVKLPDKLELVARVKYHSRAYLTLLERNEAYRTLAATQHQMAEELATAARYVQSLLPKPLAGAVVASWKFVPSSQLAGDMFGYHWLDPEKLVVYLLDVSGHGVGSALLAVSAGNVISNRSLPDTDFADPGGVLKRLNDVFQMEKQNEKYFTIWYGVFDVPTRKLRFSNAGHPAPLLFNGPCCDTAELKSLESSSFAVGMVPEWEFDTEEVILQPFARLLLFSDGVFEIDKPGGGMWHYPEFVEFIKAQDDKPPSVMDRLYEHVKIIRGGDILNDDYSMVEVRF